MRSCLITIAIVLLFFNPSRIAAQCAGFNITSVSSTNVVCNGESNGTITVTATGGTGPYSYSIGGSGTQLGGTETFDNSTSLATGASTITKFWSPSSCTTGGLVWNAGNGCTSGAVGFSGSFNNFFGCFLRSPEVNATGLNEVVVSFDVSHSYSAAHPNNRMRFYVWDNNFSSGSHYYRATSVKINNVEVGVTDINGIWLYYSQLRTCVRVDVTYDLSTIPNHNRLLFYLEPSSGYNNSHVFYTWIDNINFSSGVNYQVSSQFTGLPAGNYNVAVQDFNGCIASYSNNPVVITQPDVLALSLTPNNPTTVGGSNGSICVSASGGIAPYTYSTPSGTLGGCGVTGLSAGNYCITVTDDQACVAVQCTTLSNPSCTGFSVISASKTDVNCNGNSDGTISVSTGGGTPPYEYSINNGTSYQSGNVFQSLQTGSYTLRIRDASGCTATYASNPVVINEPAALSLSFSVNPETVSGASDGSINLTVSGGNGGNSFAWSNSATSEDLLNISGGNYCVTVTDSKNCTATDCATVQTINPDCSGFAIDAVAEIEISCNGEEDGEIEITYTGGSSPIFFSIDSGLTWQTGNGIFSDLGPGNYSIIIRDNANCTDTFADNPVKLFEPALFNPIIGQNGNVLAASGGVSYQWYLDGTEIIGATSQTYTATQSGSYSVEVTDSNGCIEESPAVNLVIDGTKLLSTINSFYVAPNPFNDRIDLNISFARPSSGIIELFDVNGMKMAGLTFEESVEFQGMMNINKLSTGLYLLKFQVKEEVFYRKLVKK